MFILLFLPSSSISAVNKAAVIPGGLNEIYDIGLPTMIAALAAALLATQVLLRFILRPLRLNKRAAAAAVLCVLILTTGISFGAYCARVLFIKNLGTSLVPDKPYSPHDVKVFLQNDPLWSDSYIGNSRFRLGGHGCLVSVLASALNDMGYDLNVKELNSIFTEKEVYDAKGEVIWHKVGQALPGVTYRYQRLFGSATLTRDLEQGRLPLVMVRYHGKGVFHWVLVVGSNDRDFIIVDPLKQDKKPDRLSTHGRIYAYRVLYRN
jgi:hypothetical protein